MEKPVKIKKDMKLSAFDRKTLLAYSGIISEAAVRTAPENITKKGIIKLS